MSFVKSVVETKANDCCWWQITFVNVRGIQRRIAKSRAESPKAYSPGYHPEVGCIELIASWKDKSIWLSCPCSCFCPYRAHTFSRSYPGRVPWAISYCPCGACNLSTPLLKCNHTDIPWISVKLRCEHGTFIERQYRWTTNDTNELNKPMNASVLPMKQIRRHEHAAWPCHIRLHSLNASVHGFQQNNSCLLLNPLLKQKQMIVVDDK